MLLIATAVPAVTSVKNSTINAIVQSISQTSMSEIWIERQKLLASDGAVGDVFGTSVSLDGDTVLIGAVSDDDNGAGSGSAYIFTRSGTTWTQQTKLLASDGHAGDQFGCFVSLFGDTALIGAGWDDDNGVDSGSAYVFTRTGTTWTQQQKLTAPDVAAGDWFGMCVSLVGDTALIGAQGDYNTGDFGAAYVFTRTGTIWTLQQELFASDGAAGDCFGWMVSLDGNTALIGADLDDDNGVDSGSAYVFTRTGTTWTQQAKLLASDGAAGDDFSGGGVALYGDTALIGAEMDDDSGTDSGSAYVFTRTGTTWTQLAKLLASDGNAGDQFSTWGLALESDTAIIGAWDDDDNGINSGSAYVFTRSGTTWTQQQKLTASDGAAGDQFGVAVSLDGDTALIGAWFDDVNGTTNCGSVYVFTKQDIPSVDVPVWQVGDSWTYNEQYVNHIYTANGTLWYLIYHNCTSTYTVTDTTGDNYTVTMTSTDNEGRVTIGSIHLKFTKYTKFTSELKLRKTDLALVSESWQEKGPVFWLLFNIVPIPAQYTDAWEYIYSIPDVTFPFPLTAGTQGPLPNASCTGHEKCSLYWGLITLFNWPDSYGYSGNQNYTCEMANITVPAGTYDAYNVSVESTYGLGHLSGWSYYVPEVGWKAKQIISADADTSGNPGYTIKSELVSTTYTP